jgi:hemerythrin-like metal-binding protein
MNNDNNTIVKYEVLPWSEHFNTGITEIDEQHKIWIYLLNTLAQHSSNCVDSVVLASVFDELFAYTQYHFQTEETIWTQFFSDDEWQIKHKHSHDSFIAQLQRLKSEENTQPLKQVVENVLEVLIPWLAYHILVSDKRMAKIVLDIQAGKSLALAKQHSDLEIANYRADDFYFKR